MLLSNSNASYRNFIILFLTYRFLFPDHWDTHVLIKTIKNIFTINEE